QSIEQTTNNQIQFSISNCFNFDFTVLFELQGYVWCSRRFSVQNRVGTQFYFGSSLEVSTLCRVWIRAEIFHGLDFAFEPSFWYSLCPWKANDFKDESKLSAITRLTMNVWLIDLVPELRR
ncbi:hypothetical protein RYX36_001566, partial [Vicia faba]